MDIDLSLARLAADAEKKRAYLETRNEALAALLLDCTKQRDLFEQERDTALYDLEREQRAHELHHGGPR